MSYTPFTPIPRRYSLMWPVVLIALGAMFLVGEFVPRWNFERTWPVILVVVGVIKLVEVSRPPRPPEGPKV